MKRIYIIGLLCALPMMLIAQGHCERGCDRKLDALSATLQRISVAASEAETSLGQYQQDCCEDCADILRSAFRAPQCSCEKTPITAPISLNKSGSYCLANDIGDGSGYAIALFEPDLQVSIDLNGHTVNGGVQLGEHSYIYNGTISGDLVLLSHSRADSIQLGGRLLGSDAQDVLVQNSLFTYLDNSGFVINNFASLILDHCTLASQGELSSSVFNIQNAVNLMLRDCYVSGDLRIDLSTSRMLETLSVYDSHITGKLALYPQDSLSTVCIWNSAIDDFHLDFTLPFGSPAILLHGLTSSHIRFNAVEQHPATKIFIDECNGGRFIFQRVSNIHCQNTLAYASPEGISTNFSPVHLESCHNGLFQDVMATNTLSTVMPQGEQGFYIANSKNFLFKKCFAIAEMGTGYSVAFTSTNINFEQCVAKGCGTGFWSTTGTSGSVFNCIADGCGTTGFSNADGAATSIVYASNVACFNTNNYSVPTATAPYYDANYTTTAGSWRNINL